MRPDIPALHTAGGASAVSALPPLQWRPENPLPHLPAELPPSPTLTNPDHILPSTQQPTVSSPPRLTRRPPSPSYLRDENGDDHSAARTTGAVGAMGGRKEKLGLMSKKMMLLRSRTAGHVHTNSNSRSTPSQGSHRDPDFIPSSPVLQDVGNLAPEQRAPEPDYLQLPESDRRSNSGGSSSSDISGMTAFLSRYGKPDGTSDDEAFLENGESPAQTRIQDHGTGQPEMDAERMRQQQEEYNSAVLSKRAEQILANAKKRLNIMEGNLRGARDLVAPLTAANLKRATSLGSAASFSPGYGRRYVHNGYEYDDMNQHLAQMLHPQSSSPTIGRDYQVGHARGFSETELPERPYTALDHQRFVMLRSTRAGAGGRGHAIVPTYGALRGARSYDSLRASSGVGYGPSHEHPLHARASPDSNLLLDPLPEDDEGRKSNRVSREPANNGLGIYRPSSRTSDIREQMNNLKGKISTLKERAREDSLRRQSQSSLRNPSPFNNALAAAPEFFYTSSQGYGSPVLDTNAGVGYTSNNTSPTSARMPDHDLWENTSPLPGSRNAFAEQDATQKPFGVQKARAVEIVAPKTPDSKFQVRPPREAHPQLPQQPATAHRRTPSGTAIVDSAKNRYSHHQHRHTHSQDSQISSELSDYDPGDEPTEDEDDYLGVPSPGLTSQPYDSSPISSEIDAQSEVDYAASDDGNSVYEDAQNEQNSVVAHEDREDAFDYEHFFLHSALGTYGHGRRGSDSSDVSQSSVETAKGPVLVEDDNDEDFNHTSAMYPPPTPETPEQLRDIERHMHSRRTSNESISTMNTYATADEAQSQPVSPLEEHDRRLSVRASRTVSPFPEDVPQAHPGARTSSRPSSRPGTAVKRTIRRGSSSDRADSGVGINDSQRRAAPPDSLTSKASKARSQGSIVSNSTPPMSPPIVTHQDPATLAVNALLDPEGKGLGLRDKAVLFGVVESLRKMVHQLQEQDESQYESRMLRRRLDDAKQALDGLAGH